MLVYQYRYFLETCKEAFWKGGYLESKLFGGARFYLQTVFGNFGFSQSETNFLKCFLKIYIFSGFKAFISIYIMCRKGLTLWKSKRKKSVFQSIVMCLAISQWFLSTRTEKEKHRKVTPLSFRQEKTNQESIFSNIGNSTITWEEFLAVSESQKKHFPPKIRNTFIWLSSSIWKCGLSTICVYDCIEDITIRWEMEKSRGHERNLQPVEVMGSSKI